ncbi:MAG: hypothetical protein ABEH78_00705 [Haloferacaceae archaeon]
MAVDAADADADVAALCERAEEAAERVETLRAERSRAREAVRERGEEAVAAAADAYREATALLDRYEDSATGTGDFEAYVEFQDRFAGLVEGLDGDLPAREAFEEAAETVDQRRLSEADFAAAREALAPASELVDLLERRDEAEERFRRASHEAREALDAVEERIERLERIATLGDADLDASVERLQDPIEAYNAAVQEAFAEFRADASARTLFALLETAERYPLVDFRRPPRDLRKYVAEYPAGEEPIPTLLEYADYSTSKLEHYVEDPGALRARVATHRTYLERLDAEPLTVGWPPPEADVLRMRGEELVSLVGRFAGEATVERARRFCDLPRRTDYDRLRRSARARAELTADQRDRLREGRVSDDIDRLREARAALQAAIEAE